MYFYYACKCINLINGGTACSPGSIQLFFKSSFASLYNLEITYNGECYKILGTDISQSGTILLDPPSFCSCSGGGGGGGGTAYYYYKACTCSGISGGILACDPPDQEFLFKSQLPPTSFLSYFILYNNVCYKVIEEDSLQGGTVEISSVISCSCSDYTFYKACTCYGLNGAGGCSSSDQELFFKSTLPSSSLINAFIHYNGNCYKILEVDSSQSGTITLNSPTNCSCEEQNQYFFYSACPCNSLSENQGSCTDESQKLYFKSPLNELQDHFISYSGTCYKVLEIDPNSTGTIIIDNPIIYSGCFCTSTLFPTDPDPDGYYYYYGCPCPTISTNETYCVQGSIFFKSIQPFLVGKYISYNSVCHKVLGIDGSKSGSTVINSPKNYTNCTCGQLTVTTTEDPRFFYYYSACFCDENLLLNEVGCYPFYQKFFKSSMKPLDMVGKYILLNGVCSKIIYEDTSHVGTQIIEPKDFYTSCGCEEIFTPPPPPIITSHYIACPCESLLIDTCYSEQKLIFNSNTTNLKGKYISYNSKCYKVLSNETTKQSSFKIDSPDLYTNCNCNVLIPPCEPVPGNVFLQYINGSCSCPCNPLCETTINPCNDYYGVTFRTKDADGMMRIYKSGGSAVIKDNDEITVNWHCGKPPIVYLNIRLYVTRPWPGQSYHMLIQDNVSTSFINEYTFVHNSAGYPYIKYTFWSVQTGGNELYNSGIFYANTP